MPKQDSNLAGIARARPTRHVMINIAAGQLRRHPGRVGAVVLAVMISVGYLTATLGFMATETHAIGAQVSARTSGADVVVSSELLNGQQLAKRLPAVRRVAGVTTAALSYQISARIGRAAPLTLQNLPTDQRLRWARLDAGRWPTTADQIALGKTAADANRVRIGDQVTIDTGDGPRRLTVTGITDETKSLFSGETQTGFVVDSFITDPRQFQADMLVIGGGISQQELADRVAQHAGQHVTVQTRDAYNAAQVERLAQGADVLRNLLLIFGAIALLVGSILIVNTFLILLAQRRRQVGLLRAVGASGSQVRRSLLVEALLTGVTGAILGVGLGIGGTALATAISGSLGDGLVIPPTVGIAAGVGIAVTVVAALGPARRATRVSPLEALRPVDDAATARRGSTISGIVAGVLAVAGTGAIIIGLRSSHIALPACIAGSMLIATAVLVGAKLYFPWLLRLIGLLVRGLGPVGRLATENTARNPGRAAATGAALMLATGLIVTLQVGAASVKASTDLTLDQHYPVDVTATTGSHRLPPEVITRIGAISGIARAATLRSVDATITTADHQQISVPLESGAELSRVINPGAGAVPADRVLIDPFLAKTASIPDGRTVTIRVGDRSRKMIIEANRIAADGVAVVAPAVLRSIAPHAPVTTVWAKATPNASVVDVAAALSQLGADHPDLQVSGSLASKAAYTKLLDTLLTIATVLLAVAVVIALIGVGNTLGLSVIERSRESALLRALGLQRGQLRLMLAIEAVLLALTGAVVGIAAGAFFGWIGTAAIGSALGYRTIIFSMSLTQTLVVSGIAIVAGMLASVLPARRAALATPVSALAET